MELLKCPGCDHQLPEDDLGGQRDHMTARHPEIIAIRLQEAGFVYDPDQGEWIDVLASDG